MEDQGLELVIKACCPKVSTKVQLLASVVHWRLLKAGYLGLKANLPTDDLYSEVLTTIWDLKPDHVIHGQYYRDGLYHLAIEPTEMTPHNSVHKVKVSLRDESKGAKVMEWLIGRRIPYDLKDIHRVDLLVNEIDSKLIG